MAVRRTAKITMGVRQLLRWAAALSTTGGSTGRRAMAGGRATTDGRVGAGGEARNRWRGWTLPRDLRTTREGREPAMNTNDEQERRMTINTNMNKLIVDSIWCVGY
jgi:hypothetical protein